MNGYMDFAGEPYLANKAAPADAFLGEYDPLKPNTGLGSMPAVTKAIIRPKPGAVPGWPGFFGWLAAQHPGFYDYARVSLPNLVEDRQGIVSAGSQLGDYRGTRVSETGRVLNGMGDYRGTRRTETGRVLNGLVDPQWDDPADTMIAPWRSGGDMDPASTIMNGLGAVDMNAAIQAGSMISQSATEGITNSTPMPTSLATSSIADTLAKLAATFIPLYGQKKIFDLQLERAKQGLPPLDTSNIIDSNAGLNVGITKGTQNTILMIAGLGLAALLLSKLVKKR